MPLPLLQLPMGVAAIWKGLTGDQLAETHVLLESLKDYELDEHIAPLLMDEVEDAQELLEAIFARDFAHLWVAGPENDERVHELVRGVVKSQLDIGLKYGHVLCFRGVKGLHGVLVLLPPMAFSTSARLSMRMARGPEPVTAKVWGAGAAGRFELLGSAFQAMHDKATCHAAAHWHVTAVGVGSEYRGSGVGRALMSATIAIADSRKDIFPIYLEVCDNPPLCNFFRHFQFKIAQQQEVGSANTTKATAFAMVRTGYRIVRTKPRELSKGGGTARAIATLGQKKKPVVSPAVQGAGAVVAGAPRAMGGAEEAAGASARGATGEAGRGSEVPAPEEAEEGQGDMGEGEAAAAVAVAAAEKAAAEKAACEAAEKAKQEAAEKAGAAALAEKAGAEKTKQEAAEKTQQRAAEKPGAEKKEKAKQEAAEKAAAEKAAHEAAEQAQHEAADKAWHKANAGAAAAEVARSAAAEQVAAEQVAHEAAGQARKVAEGAAAAEKAEAAAAAAEEQAAHEVHEAAAAAKQVQAQKAKEAAPTSTEEKAAASDETAAAVTATASGSSEAGAVAAAEPAAVTPAVGDIPKASGGKKKKKKKK